MVKKIKTYWPLITFLWIWVILLSSCGSFQYVPSRVESVLAVTNSGDTIQVPLSQIRDNYSFRNFNNWQFYYGSDWYFWNEIYLRYPRFSGFYSWYHSNRFNNYRSYIRPKVNQRRRLPQTTQPQRPRYRIATPRGSRPNYVQPQRSQRSSSSPTRTQSTPNVVRRNNVGRSSSGGRKIDH